MSERKFSVERLREMKAHADNMRDCYALMGIVHAEEAWRDRGERINAAIASAPEEHPAISEQGQDEDEAGAANLAMQSDEEVLAEATSADENQKEQGPTREQMRAIFAWRYDGRNDTTRPHPDITIEVAERAAITILDADAATIAELEIERNRYSNELATEKAENAAFKSQLASRPTGVAQAAKLALTICELLNYENNDVNAAVMAHLGLSERGHLYDALKALASAPSPAPLTREKMNEIRNAVHDYAAACEKHDGTSGQKCEEFVALLEKHVEGGKEDGE